VPAGLALAAGLALLVLAVPRFGAGLQAVVAGGAVDALAAGRPVSGPALERAAAAASAAAARTDDARQWGRAALLRQAAALAEPSAGVRAAGLAEAAEAARRAVAAGPAAPYHWHRLAELELLRRGVTPAAARAVAMALRQAPQTRVLLLERLDLAFLAWPSLGGQARADAAAGIRLAAGGRDLAALASLARRRHALAPVRQALAAVPALRAAFDAAYLATPGG